MVGDRLATVAVGEGLLQVRAGRLEVHRARISLELITPIAQALQTLAHLEEAG